MIILLIQLHRSKTLDSFLTFFSYTFLTNLAVSPISYAFKVIHLESDHVILSPQLPPLFCCATFWLPLYLPVVCPPSYQRGPSGLLYLWLQNVLRTWFVMPLFQFCWSLKPVLPCLMTCGLPSEMGAAGDTKCLWVKPGRRQGSAPTSGNSRSFWLKGLT